MFQLDNRYNSLNHMVHQNIHEAKPLKLYNALNIGYLRDVNKQSKRLKAYGYRIIPELTSREYLNAYNPISNKIIHISNGTDFTNGTDLQNNILNSTWGRSGSRRTNEEKLSLNSIKQMYPNASTTLIGHSLGAQYSNYIGTRDDKVLNYNPHLNFNSIVRPNVQNYRTSGDIVSMGAHNSNTKTLQSHEYDTHGLSNIKNENIFI